MPKNKLLYYWDTSIFLAWMLDEKRSQGEMDGVSEVVSLVMNNSARILTSVLTRTEILEVKLDDVTKIKFSKLFERPNIVLKNVDLKISDLGSQIRSENLSGQRKIKSPDAIHMATAIINNATEMHTFDNQLISLSGRVTARHILKICKPQGAPWTQRNLF